MKKQPEITNKTRQKFVDAFWTLAKEKPVSKIAVSEVTRLAGYNRSTFYEYFLDTDDLLSYIEDDLIEEVKRTASQTVVENKSLSDFFATVFALMNEKIYILLGPNGDSSFFPRVKSELVPLVSQNLPITVDTENFDYLVSFANSAVFGILEHWNDKNKDISAEEICDLLQRLVLGGVMGYINGEDFFKRVT